MAELPAVLVSAYHIPDLERIFRPDDAATAARW